MGNGSEPESEREHFAKDPKEAKCLDLGAKYKGEAKKVLKRYAKYYADCQSQKSHIQADKREQMGGLYSVAFAKTARVSGLFRADVVKGLLF